jgi:hypothetical protein
MNERIVLLLTGSLGTILGMNIKQPLENALNVPEKVPNAPFRIKPKCHVVRYNLLTGRARYPFKAMLVDDYILLDSHDHAIAARNALKTFYRRYVGRRFSVKEDGEGYWVCRRTV